MLKLTALTRPLAAARRTRSADSVGRHRERLLAHHVPAGGEDRLDLRVVQLVGRRDVDDVDAVVREQLVEATRTRARRPSAAARCAARSRDEPSSPTTLTPIRRSASMCTVPMKPLPMTAVPMSLRRSMWRWMPSEWRSWCRARGSASSLDGLRAMMQVAGRRRGRRVGSSGRRGDAPGGAFRFGSCALSASCGALSDRHRTSACQERKSRDRPARRAYDPADGRPARAPPATPCPGPSPEETLDALVAVLDEVRLGHSQSRSDLVAHTGLSRSIVAQRVAELLDRGLVVEGEPGPSTGGRPPRQLTFRARRRARAGRGPRRDEHRRRGHHARRPGPRPPRRAGEHRRRARRSRSGGSRSCSGSCSRRRAGCRDGSGASGSACPGPVEFGTGRPISPPIMPGWDGYPVRERLSARYDAPVWVDNDVNVLALGEWRSRHRRGPRQRGRRQGRHGHRRRDHRRRPAAPRRAGLGGRRRAHPGLRRPRRRVPLRQRRLPRGAGGRRGDRARRRDGRARGPEPAAARGARPARDGDRRGRRPGGVVRRPGRGRAARRGGPADRLDARQRRELLQPVAGRDRGRRRPERRRAAGLDPGGGLRPVAAARDARPARSAARRWAGSRA